ncbi:TonB-dependent receptor [Luteitalea pratensis]|uniref:TonB-dependent receptor n=1 Tax=Luteitalea pratensis TaxID=1855912 RepID=UPI00139002E0|nr:carboxypeptidase-like regulatory domain-containing protein [Luteitalea pratensis]
MKHCVFGLAAVVSLHPAAALAQNVTGTILGTVRDATGAGVPDAQVTLTHTATGLARVIATGSSGDYAAPLLGTGVYSVTAQAPGFSQALVTGIQVSVDQTVRVDLSLEIGALTDSISVEATNPLVRRSSSDVSATLGMAEIQMLPLVTRNFVQLTRTIPGVARGVAGENLDGAGSVGWRNSASFTANGQRPRDNNFLLDGVDNNETWLNTVAIFPSVDALDEFKVRTSIYAAEFGRSTGGVVSLQTRSGANTFRGSGFGFLRDDRFDANDWFNNRAGRPRPDFGQHQFGGTLGGPLVKNRTFFFTDYQGTRIKQDLTLVSTVPSEAMRRGDFSEINRVIYDATTGLPFPGNVVPPGRLDETARRVVEQLYPLPNTTGQRASTGQTIDNYVINPTLRRRENQFDVRIDHALTTANRLFARYSAQYAEREIPPSLPQGDGGVGGGFGLPGVYDIDAGSLAVNDTHVFAPQWLNEFRLGWSSIDVGFAPFGFGQDTSEQLGIPGINLDERTSGMVTMSLPDMRGLGSGGGPLRLDMSALQLTDSVTHVRGRHTVKSGASLILRKRIVDTSGQIGLFAFNSSLTSSCAGRQGGCAPLPASGFSFADLVLGYPSLFNRGLLEAPYTERRPEWAGYLQDDFRVSGGLTLNLGVRWDLFVPYAEDDNRQSNFDTSTGQFVVASDDAVLAGVEVGRRLQTYSRTNFAPRMGFAHDVKGEGRTVVRGGFGMFWNSPFTGTSGSKGQNPPFLLAQTLTNPSPFVPTISLSSGRIPATPLTGGTSRSSFDPNFRDGYAQQWNLGVQHQIGRNSVVDVGYIGSRGRQLVVLVDVNQARATLGVANPNVNRPFFRVNPTLASVVQSTPKGTLDYHALQARFVRRFSDGLSVQTSYTFAKAIDLDSETDGLSRFPNSYDLTYNRGPANYDLRHVLTSNWIYVLPFARDTMLGGWQVSGILLVRSGYPFTVFQDSNPSSTVTAGFPLYRPDRIGPGHVENPTVDRWFAVEDFIRPTEPTATYGSSGRNILRGPGQFTIDASVGKLTRVGRVETEFRVEAFNLLNQPAFANPASTIGTGNVGTISSLLPFTPMRQLQFVLKARF